MFKNNLEIITLNKPNITDFAKERNILLQNSKADWVLFLDSDENLSKPIKDISDINNGYVLRRKNYFLGQYVGIDQILRLGKRNSGKWIRGVHEIWQVKEPIGTLPNYIIHNTAYNLHDYINKINEYALIHSQENMREGKRSALFQIVFYPIGKFVVTLIKSKNIVFSIMQSFHSFLAWSELWISQRS